MLNYYCYKIGLFKNLGWKHHTMEYDARFDELKSKHIKLLVEAQKKRDEIRPVEELGFQEGFIFTEEGYFTSPSSGVDLINLQEELESIEKEQYKTRRELQQHVIEVKRKVKR